ncbi:N-formylglutamate amidohydrolase [Phaeobacter sp. 22II1-1F12B]|uniref:N-formylglutamate amidohydrolase n=1 Tax=Phaeobacter sp. 22II1-1F12B TaxID=1317111 RepID=UPI000B521984|nr:N-formylglutamate amidohydrolase [Phaeobacter sp. 22II1-1F12B]
MPQDQTAIAAATFEGAAAPAPVLLVCEHASCDFPEEFGDLGLSDEVRQSHVAWDPGALALSRQLAAALQAPLVFGQVSRLLYDCNRPPEAQDAIPAKSEIYEIPGNMGLSDEAKAERVSRIYDPFCAAMDKALEDVQPAMMVTVHSFTPVYFGAKRDVEIGILHDEDTRLADALLEELAGAPHKVERNQPYGPQDGVTHSLKRHAMSRGIANVMLEIRNDLLNRPELVVRMGGLLSGALGRVMSRPDVRDWGRN